MLSGPVDSASSLAIRLPTQSWRRDPCDIDGVSSMGLR
jgi:hypothetical protein